MVKIKICGIRKKDDIDTVNRYLPDYVGFVFAQSKRRILPEHARVLSKSLDISIGKVGVFVNEDPLRVADIASDCGLDVVQVHGDETPQYLRELKKYLCHHIKIWKAIRVKDIGSIKFMAVYEGIADCFVLDTYSRGSYGGNGVAFDWRLAKEASEYGNIILAGGLNPRNVREALKIVKPFAVDVSSGVETDGMKDEVKIKEFIYSIRCNTY